MALFTLLIRKIKKSTHEGSDKVIIHPCHVVHEDSFKSTWLHTFLTGLLFFSYPALPLCSGFSPSLCSSPCFVHFCQLLLIQACPVHRLNFLLMCTCTQADLCDDRGQTVVLKVSRGEWRWRGWGWGVGLHF